MISSLTPLFCSLTSDWTPFFRYVVWLPLNSCNTARLDPCRVLLSLAVSRFSATVHSPHNSWNEPKNVASSCWVSFLLQMTLVIEPKMTPSKLCSLGKHNVFPRASQVGRVVKNPPANAGKWKVKVKSLSRVRLLTTPWTAAHQAPPSMGFSRQEEWSGVPLKLGRPGYKSLVTLNLLFNPSETQFSDINKGINNYLKRF